MVGIKDFDMPEDCKSCKYKNKCFYDPMIDSAYLAYEGKKKDNCPLVETIPKADYENRLKADLVAILTEIQLEIEETAKDAHINAFMNGYKDMYLNGISASAIKCSEIIQQKIKSLKENT